MGGQKKIWGHKSSGGYVRNLGGTWEIWGVHEKFGGYVRNLGGVSVWVKIGYDYYMWMLNLMGVIDLYTLHKDYIYV
jgi:hypothetical protein